MPVSHAPPCVRARLFRFWLFVNQNGLLPFAGLLVGTMNAACPTARTLLTFCKLLNCPPNSPCSCLVLLRVFYPANVLVTSDRGQVLSQVSDLFRLDECVEQVIGHVMQQPARTFCAKSQSSLYCGECKPIMLPSVSIANAMNPCSPIENFSCWTLPPASGTRASSDEQSEHVK